MTEAVSNKIKNLGVVGALMVVMIHLPKCAESPVGVLNRILPDALLGSAVMMFFVISGFLIGRHVMEAGWWMRECRKRLSSLLVPYLVLNVFYFGVMLAYHALGSRMGVGAGSYGVRDFFAALGFIPDANGGGNPIVGPLWYVRCLLLAIVTLPLSMPVIRRGKNLALMFCALVYCVNICVSGHGGFFFDSVFRLQGVACFLLGVTFSLYGLPSISKRIGCLALIGAFCLVGGMEFFGAGILGQIPFWTIKPIALVAMWGLIPSTAWPELLTRNTFAIYSLHYLMTHPAWLVADHLGVYSKVFGSVITYFGFPVLIFISIISFAAFLRSRLPQLATVILGGR